MPLEAVSTINYVDDGRFLVVELVHGLAVLFLNATTFSRAPGDKWTYLAGI